MTNRQIKLVENYIRKIVRKTLNESTDNSTFFNEIVEFLTKAGCKIQTHTERQVIGSRQTKTDNYYFNVQYRTDINEFDIFCDCKIEVDAGRSLADPKAAYQTTSARVGVKYKKLKINEFGKTVEDSKMKLNKYITKLNKVSRITFELIK